MDWIGNFRFHWMEFIIYDTLKWVPLVLLGAKPGVLLGVGVGVGVVSTLVGHLNHTNTRFDWGPLRYVFNSPRMHLWHHDYMIHFKAGQNFGVITAVTEAGLDILEITQDSSGNWTKTKAVLVAQGQEN